MIPVIYNVRSLAARRITTLVTAVGVGLVVFVFAAALMLGQGIRHALGGTGEPDNATALRQGSPSDIQSSVELDQEKVLCSRPEVVVGADGTPICAGELSVLIEAEKIDGSGMSNVQMRGIRPVSFQIHAAVHITEGRAPRPGTSEIIVGKAIAGRFKGFALGDTAHWLNRDWPVVGVFEAGGSAFESQVWGDVEVLMQAFKRPAYSTVTMRLKDRSQLDAVAAQVAADPRLKLAVKGERAWYESQSEQMSTFLTGLGIFISILFAVGATIGAVITMYAQVASRVREIGTMRAIGFPRGSVLVSFLIEAMLLALLGCALGLLGATLMGLVTFSTVNFQSFSEISFRFTPDPSIYGKAVIFSLVMGFLGGFLPAWRASRMSPIEAMRTE